MKTSINKTKTILTSLRIAIISLPYKVMSILEDSISNWSDSQVENFQTDYWIMFPELTKTPQQGEIDINEINTQWLYWVPFPSEPTPITAIKVAEILLIAITFIIWIINFIKIKKIDDKTLKRKKIRNTIIIVLILSIAIFLISQLLIRVLTP